MRTMKHLALAAMTATALALAGCGGGGSSPPPASSGPSLEDKQKAQRTDIQDAVAAAATAVAAVNDDADANTVAAADAAVAAATKAISDAADIPDAEKAGYSTAVAAHASALKTAKDSRTAAANKAADDAQKAMTAKAKALKKAITAGASVAGTMTSIPAIDLDGDGNTDTAALTLKKGAAAGSLGAWMGTDYAGSDGAGDAKTTGMSRAYSNAEAAKNVPFDSSKGNAIHGLTIQTNGKITNIVNDSGYVATNVGGGIVPSSGTDTHKQGDEVAGSYMGASGTFTCNDSSSCGAVRTTAGGVTLNGNWDFAPGASAMLQQKDANYLHFGWWTRSDKDGVTHAGVFYGQGGTGTALTPVASGTINNAALVGEATYMGSAAGKFAVKDPLNAANDNAGHFTADAELNADFKATNSTLSGTIDAFRLNDGSTDPGWSVALQKASFDSTANAFKTGSTPNDDQTVWSIGDASGGASGNWEAQMFNDKATDDGSNVPDSVVGEFSSSIGTTHSMVGAFGATKQ